MRSPGIALWGCKPGSAPGPLISQQRVVHGGPNKQKRGPASRLKLIDLHRPRNPRLLMPCRARHVIGQQRGRPRDARDGAKWGASASGAPEWKKATTKSATKQALKNLWKHMWKSRADFWTEECRCHFSLRISSEILGPCRAWLGAATPGPPRAHFWLASAGGGRGRARASCGAVDERARRISPPEHARPRGVDGRPASVQGRFLFLFFSAVH